MASKRRIGSETSATRAAILKAALQVLQERGSSHFTASEIARKAGVKPHMIHYYFRTIDDLVPALREMAPIAARNIGAMIGDCDVLVTATATGIDVAVKTDKRFKPEKLVPVAQRLKLARLALNREVIFQARPPTVAMGKAHVELPVGSFLQATEAAEHALAALVVAGLGKPKAVADLFSGCGPFALRTRLEERMIDGVPETALRLRERFGLALPLDSKARWTLLASGELFFQLNRTRPSDVTGLNAVRTQLGFRHALTPALSLTALYQRQQGIRRGAQDTVAHISVLAIGWAF